VSRDYARARLDGADFTGDELAGADFFAASAVRAKFTRADLTQATLCAGNFAHASFVLADLSGARLDGATFYGADLRAADLRGVTTSGTDFEETLLFSAKLDRKRVSRKRKQAADAGFPSFGDAIDTGIINTLHWRLSPSAILCLEAITLDGTDPTPEVVALLRQQDPRFHQLAAAMLVAHPCALDEAWAALERGSWASPQIAAALHRVDPRFAELARSRKFDPKASEAIVQLLENRRGIATLWCARLARFEPTRL
jgi:hypothetical protein